MQDYYTTLGVSDSATEDEIKKAFRGLAMQHHPDKNPGNAEAEAKFKTINEAYATLSDPNKRAEYDNMKRYGGGPQMNRGGGPSGFNHEFHFNFGGPGGIDDIINQFFHQNGFGGGFPFGQQQQRRNRDFQFNMDITLEEAFSGKDMPINFNANGQDTNIVVRIPAGIDTGSRLRFQGHGDRSMQGIPPGDLFVNVNIVAHPTFRRDGPHLHAQISVDALDAIVGCDVDIPCIDGSTVRVHVTPGTQHGSTLRVAGKGMPKQQNSRERGDVLISVHISTPQGLSSDQLSTLRTIVAEIKNKKA
jgi:curved DNA-binding protein